MRLVTCAEAVWAIFEWTFWPSSSTIEPLLPVPRRILPAGERAAEKMRSSREVQRDSGEPSGVISTTSEPPVVEGKNGNCGVEAAGEGAGEKVAPLWPRMMAEVCWGVIARVAGASDGTLDFSRM